MKLAEDLENYIHGQCLQNLLRAQSPQDGWFVAAPSYPPYGNYVWLRDNAECAMALDEYAAAIGESKYLDYSSRAILRAFRYLESVEKGVTFLSSLRAKIKNP